MPPEPPCNALTSTATLAAEGRVSDLSGATSHAGVRRASVADLRTRGAIRIEHVGLTALELAYRPGSRHLERLAAEVGARTVLRPVAVVLGLLQPRHPTLLAEASERGKIARRFRQSSRIAEQWTVAVRVHATDLIFAGQSRLTSEATRESGREQKGDPE